MSDTLRGTPLGPDDKKRLTKLLDELKLVAKASGQIVIHINDGNVTGFTQGLIFR